MIDSKENTTDSVYYLPYPIEPAFLGSIKVTFQYLSNLPIVYLFGVENLTPGKKVKISSFSGPERIEGIHEVPLSGTIGTFVRPAVEGLEQAEAVFELQCEEGTLRIEYPWSKKPVSSNLLPGLVIFTIDHEPTSKEIEEAKKEYVMSFLLDQTV